MTISFDNALGVHPTALKLRSARAEMLAGNVANADTPNFKARDIDFKTAMAAAHGEAGSTSRRLATSANGTANLSVTRSGHLSGQQVDNGPAGLADAIRYRTPLAASVDNNSVDVQREQAEIARNNVQLQAALRFVDSRFKGLNTALKGE